MNNAKEAYFKIDKWMPDEQELQDEFYEIIDSGDVEELKEYLELYADEGNLRRYYSSLNYKKLAQEIIKYNNTNLNESFDIEEALFESQQEFEELNEGFKDAVKHIGKSTIKNAAGGAAVGAIYGGAKGAGKGASIANKNSKYYHGAIDKKDSRKIKTKTVGKSAVGGAIAGGAIGAVAGGVYGAVKGTVDVIKGNYKKTPVKKTPVKKTPVKKTPVKTTPVKKTPPKKINEMFNINQALNESQQEFTDLFESVNQKPKLSAKKQLATYKTCSLNSVDYVLLEEKGPTNKGRYVIKFQDGWDLKRSISDLFEDDEISNNWWSVDIHNDDPYENDEDVIYLLENFDQLMK